MLNIVETLPATVTSFGDLQVSDRLAASLRAMAYTTPTPIQAQAIPPLLAGKDVVGLARTGSGKTAGFGIPLVESIDPSKRHVQALVLVPTRELAAQVAAELTRLSQSSNIRVAAVYGGVGMGNQIAALRGSTHVVVGTPGRVIDHLQRGTLDLRQVHFVVLDEADRMLDVGFAPAIEDILRRTPTRRQTALFSATFPAEVASLGARHTRDAVRVSVDPPGVALETLEERFVRVPQESAKLDALHEILIAPECKLALVFRRTTHRADKLVRELEHRGFKVAVLHGRRSQSQRERALAALRAGQLQVLVATDIAARGLDIAGLTHVVNFDLPDTAENYTHRVGRTARMGADGIAITLVTPDDERPLEQLQRRLAATLGHGASAEGSAARGGVRQPRQGRVQPRPQTQDHAPAAPARHDGKGRNPHAGQAARGAHVSQSRQAGDQQPVTQSTSRSAGQPASFRGRPTQAGSMAPRRPSAGAEGDENWVPFQLPTGSQPWQSRTRRG